MIRIWVVLLITVLVVSGCASWKKPQENQALEPGTFSIGSVNVETPGYTRLTPEVAVMMQGAAEKSRVAYNNAVGGDGNTYRMLLSLDHLTVDRELHSFLPVTRNKIGVTATLVEERSGKLAKRLQLSHQLVSVDLEETREQQLLRGILPKTFNQLYGVRSTPADVLPIVNSRNLFSQDHSGQDWSLEGAGSIRSTVQAVEYDSEAPSGNEPKVISCAVC